MDFVTAENQWLNQRFDYDSRSRNLDLEKEFLASLAELETINIIDLGSGSGANLKYLSPKIDGQQVWHLIERDKSLMNHAEKTIELVKQTNQAKLRSVHKIIADFTDKDLNVFKETERRVFLANAVFDIIPLATFLTFLDLLGSRPCNNVILYFTIHINEDLTIQPIHPLNQKYLSLFHQHMQRDQNGKRAMGPNTVREISNTLSQRGFLVKTADSSWDIKEDSSFLKSNFDFIICATRELLGPKEVGEWEEWVQFHLKAIDQGKSRLHVGHQDILAYWP